ncbi:MAG TPA: Hsp70 family protein [Thermodesulfobacteriota bacterium]|nr:Hsp70 family protein [Thermodesulfobacteriota bacterium]
MDKVKQLSETLLALKTSTDRADVRGVIINAARQLPKTAENLRFFEIGFELIDRIEDASDKRIAVLDFVKEIPFTTAFHALYARGMEAAVVAADALAESHHRTTELLRLADELPRTREFLELRVLVWRLALTLPARPRFFKPSLEAVAKELPKSSDYSFYRRYTLLGIAKIAPKDGPFLPVYREAIGVAIDAANTISEPYYRKYALLAIAGELPKTEEFYDLFKQAIIDASKASGELKDPFAREHAIIEMVQAIPKTTDFFPLLQEIVAEALAFFTVKRWMDDIEVTDVVDFILSAEELGIKESKKKRFSREKYAGILARELGEFGMRLNDVRFIETLKPYTHVWVQPKRLRNAVKSVVEHLETLKDRFHGREVERPVFVKEVFPDELGRYIHRKENGKGECVAIDLGATNTVVMRKKGDAPPDFVDLGEISRNYDRVPMVPTILSAETNTIGAVVTEENPFANIKQLLLEGNPKGREQMERFFRILYQHLKKATASGSGWFSLIPRNITDQLYITVPVGYTDYRGAMKGIVEKAARGTRIEFIEEPLAAAVGYQVATERDKVMMVVDFGGSTLNTMVLRLNINEVHIVAKPERAQILGGRDIDIWLAEHLARRAGLPEETTFRLLSVAEDIKIGLSRSEDVPFVWEGREVGRVTREEFEEVLDRHDFYRFVDRAVSYVLKRAEKVGVKKDRIEAVLLTGGSSQIPSFKDKLAYIFPDLRNRNQVYDHSPLTAVGMGAALYGTRDVTDRHLGMAYALRYMTTDKEVQHSYSIVLEKGEILPLEKTFSIRAAKKLNVQSEISLELFEVPESFLTRRWVTEGGIEFIKQELASPSTVVLKPLKTVTLQFKEPVEDPVEVTFVVAADGALTVKYGPDYPVVDTGLVLQ